MDQLRQLSVVPLFSDPENKNYANTAGDHKAMVPVTTPKKQYAFDMISQAVGGRMGMIKNVCVPALRNMFENYNGCGERTKMALQVALLYVLTPMLGQMFSYITKTNPSLVPRSIARCFSNIPWFTRVSAPAGRATSSFMLNMMGYGYSNVVPRLALAFAAHRVLSRSRSLMITSTTAGSVTSPGPPQGNTVSGDG